MNFADSRGLLVFCQGQGQHNDAAVFFFAFGGTPLWCGGLKINTPITIIPCFVAFNIRDSSWQCFPARSAS